MSGASRWFYRERSSADGRGPVSFAELAALIADGSLNGTSLTRRSSEHEWRAADSVIGLMRAAVAVKAAADFESIGGNAQAEPSGPTESKPNSSVLSGLRVLISWKRLLPLTLVLCGGIWLLIHWYESTKRFPRPAHVRAEPIRLPLLGQVSDLEAGMLVVDGLLLAFAAVVVLRRKLSNK